MAEINHQISIIVPVYNASKSIEKCLRSIMCQSSQCYEVIIIDDGSIDNTFAIVERCIENNRHFQVIHQENRGVSCSRNVGIEKAQGDYLLFLDADDLLPEHAIDYYLDAIGTSTADLIYGNYEVSEFGKTSAEITEFPSAWMNSHVSSHDVLIELLSQSSSLAGSVWRILFKVDFLRNSGVKFPENVHMSEDFSFVLDVLRSKPNLYVLNKTVYRYCINSESVTRNFIPSMRRDMEYVNNKILRLANNNESLVDLYYDCVANTCVCLLCNALYLKKFDRRVSSCVEVLTSPVYSDAILKLGAASSISRYKRYGLKIARRLPLLTSVLLSVIK